MVAGKPSAGYAAPRARSAVAALARGGVGERPAAPAAPATPAAPAAPAAPAMVAALGTVSAVILFAAAPDLPRPGPMEAAAVVILFLALWLTRTVSDCLAAILVFISAVGVVGVPPEIALSGFHSGAAWLVFGGLIVGAAIKTTGLGGRIAGAMQARSGRSYGRIVFGAAAAGTLLAFVAPSAVGRVMMLLPIVLAFADRLGFAAGSKGRHGLVLAAVLGTVIPSFAILPSTIAQIAMTGAAQNLYGIEFTYGAYLAANFPVLGVASLILPPALIRALFRDAPRPPAAGARRGPMSGDERRLVAILGAALVLWGSDAVHGIAPAWIALGAGVLCLAPGIGPARAIAVEREVPFGVWLLIAAVISLGAVINYCGLGEAVGVWLVERLPLERGATAWNVAVLTVVGSGVSLAATVLGAPVVMTPLAQHFATAAGWPLEGVLLLQVPTWCFFPSPHQVTVVLAALAMARVPLWPATRLLIAFSAIGFAVVLPLHAAWLGLLGYLP